MTSYLLSLVKKFGPRTGTTITSPNSWAAISIWRRFFQLKDEEHEEQLEAVFRALEEYEAQIEPVATPAVVQARKEFVRDGYRQLIQPTTVQVQPTYRGLRLAMNANEHAYSNQRLQLIRHERENQQLNHPNLSIPRNYDESVFLAQ